MNDLENKMISAVSHFEKELNSLRTSRANPSMLDNILIDAYESKTPLNQHGNISVQDASTITIQVWDSSLIKAIENAITESYLGINPQTDGQIIRLPIPKLSEERRIEIIKIASKLKKKVVIGTTGFNRNQENQIKKFSKKIPILKAGNMSLGVNLLMYLTEIASKSLNDEYLSKIFEVHHKHKKDYPSGTALMLGKGIADGKNKNLYNLIGKKFLNKKSFPYGNKINFSSIRKGEIIGEHEVKFSNGKEIITLNHEAFERTLYSDGALTASKWLMKKRPGLYSMRDLLNFS